VADPLNWPWYSPSILSARVDRVERSWCRPVERPHAQTSVGGSGFPSYCLHDADSWCQASITFPSKPRSVCVVAEGLGPHSFLHLDWRVQGISLSVDWPSDADLGFEVARDAGLTNEFWCHGK